MCLRDRANGVLDSAQEAMDIHSPSRVTRDELGKPIVEGIAVGIAEGGDEVSDALQ